MSKRITENLAVDAFDQAYLRESPAAGLIVHTDQGSQYASKAFQQRVSSVGAIQSMSRKGNPYDNAVAESFFKTFKRELVKGANYQSRIQAQQEIFKYIELYYNTKRMHSSLGYLSPLSFERSRDPKPLTLCQQGVD